MKNAHNMNINSEKTHSERGRMRRREEGREGGCEREREVGGGGGADGQTDTERGRNIYDSS